jgi:primary-amine oxidase
MASRTPFVSATRWRCRRPGNPCGNAWVVGQTPLRRESEAKRLADGRAARYWKITNPGRKNGTGEAVAYRLVPRDSVLPFCQPDTHIMRRAEFGTRHLWVTAYDHDQRFPAGDYLTSIPAGTAWSVAYRPLETPTWWCGIRSPRATSCDRRTGR